MKISKDNIIVRRYEYWYGDAEYYMPNLCELIWKGIGFDIFFSVIVIFFYGMITFLIDGFFFEFGYNILSNPQKYHIIKSALLTFPILVIFIAFIALISWIMVWLQYDVFPKYCPKVQITNKK